ncbi:flavodoxin [Lachnospiraceae bacterium]|nr:flavodoxin [Lachnospiraceae bacterium]
MATVSSKGIVTAKKAGTVTITAKAAKGKAASKCKIKVNKASKGKVLVAYFSATGTTEGVAKKVANASGGKLYEIVPQKAYTSADLNYNNDNCRANKEMENENARPAIKGSVKNMASYDVIYIGFPIWWETAPRIIDTFVESYDFSGKTIIPFCTSGSSGISTASSDLKKLCNGNPTWKKGRRFEGSASQGTVNKLVDSLGLK